MAWKETCVVEQRYEFCLRALKKDKPFTHLCAEYDISPRHGRKWLKRFQENGRAGLVNGSRKPKSNSRSPSLDVFCDIIRIRDKEDWGCGKNLRVVLLRKYPEEMVPSARTIDRILHKTGLVEKRKRRRWKPSQRLEAEIIPEGPNDLWTIDFKGWWFTKDQSKCQPLTVRDQFSRYLLGLQALPNQKTELVQECMTDLFRQHGLPAVIRSDNGSPFAHADSLLGLTKLSAWWSALGIQLDRSRPGKPQDNGAHERMHKDMLKLEKRPQSDLITQQAAFDHFRNHFNTVRPHQALGMQTPNEVYQRSREKYPETGIELVYPENFEVRRVSKNGTIRKRRHSYFLTHAITGYDVGLQHTEDGTVLIWFGNLCLGETDANLLTPLRPRQ